MFTKQQKLLMGGALLFAVLLVAGSYFGSRRLYVPDVEPVPEQLLSNELRSAQMNSLDYASASQDVALRFILKHEAGLNTNEPAHVGGVSYAGITANAWTEWRDRQSDKAHLPANVIRLSGVNASQGPLTLTDANLVVIKRFYRDYFECYHCWAVHPCLQAGYADFATLAGANATRVIQSLVNVKPDGIWKTNTTLAVKKFNDNIDMALKKGPDFAWKVFLKFDVRKREFLKTLAKQDSFYASALPGWLSRSNNLKAAMKSYLLNDKV